jgi:formyltetrahydrofolate deformylase
MSAKSAKPEKHILRIQAPDRVGIIHDVSAVLKQNNCNIITNGEFVDRATQQFFMRTAFTGDINLERLNAELTAALPEGTQLQHSSSLEQKKVVVLATKEYHCLADLLVHHYFNKLNAQVLAVVSNHDTLRPLVEKLDVPYHHVPADGLEREEHEAKIRETLAPYQPDLLVLAKYMRILTPSFIRQFPQRIINIHHSFLPAFIGARPYHQAHQRGVKIIGATAHFVTDDLDEGPIIVQQVIPTDHSKSVAEMTRQGHDVEKIVLSRALKLVLEDRVFVCNNRTIIFE